MNNRLILSLSLACLPALAGSLPAHAGTDAGHGAKVFKEECAECHSILAGKNKKGPSLFGVVGRNAGSIPDYVYSDAIKGSGVVWTPNQLDAYIAGPGKLVRGNKMKYDGLSEAGARADLIEFLNNTH